jgi:N4-gp56 family major capsid protein
LKGNEKTMATTHLSDIINPQVMGDMLEAKIPAMLKFTPFAKVDKTLVGVAGDTKTVPSWNFIGAAEDVAEGGEIQTKKLTASSTTFTIKKIMQSVGITQESINSGLGDPVGQAETQLAKAIAVKLDADVLDVLMTASLAYDGSATKINYDGIVDAIAVLDEEENTDKVMFINPAQVATLRKDANFIDKNKYGNDVMVTGEIGMVGNTRLVTSKQIVKNDSGNYVCPIVKLEPASNDTEYAESELPAVTYFLKKDTSVDHEWFPKKQTHDITAAKYGGVALTNASKVVLATFKA